jgi:hypothetical protein
MKIYIIAILAFASFSSTSFGTSLTASDCRKFCEVGPTGWCIGLGTSAQQTAAPYISILHAIQTGLNGKIQDACDLDVVVTGSSLKIEGANCSIHQKSSFSNTEMTTEFSGAVSGFFSSPAQGIYEATFTQNKPVFTFSTSSTFFSGLVTSVTSSTDPDGTPKVVWSNGELCFSALVDYP